LSRSEESSLSRRLAPSLRAIRVAAPAYRVDDYFVAFRFPPDAQALFRLGAARIGLD
jgi:hypothetical protein